MKVLDNFHCPPMVVAPWVDYGNYPTLESLIEKRKKYVHDFYYLKNVFFRRLTDVTLLNQDENTILSKIRYPDLPGSVMYGHLKYPTSRVKPYKLVLGIASVARPPGVDYLAKVNY